MNRIDRISAILIQLQSRKTVKAQDIAERFAISLRTVYRDMRSLEEAGIPIIGEAGIGYSLMEGYRLPPVMFTREEATAFITAEKLVSSLTDAVNGTNYSSALYKIKAVMRNAEKDYIEHIDERIQVVKANRPLPLQSGINPLQTILDAIAGKKVMQLDYFAHYRQEHTQRLIEPIGVFYLDNYWHLIAYCKERNACRDFRFDRILAISITAETFVDVHISLKEYLSELYKDMKLHEITIHVRQEAVLHLGEQKYYFGYLSENKAGTGVDMHFLAHSIEGFARWYMSFADYAQIIKPVQLQDRVQAIYKGIGENIKNI
jgi:predicted DNA-binding transcriptional regulator YafY